MNKKKKSNTVLGRALIKNRFGQSSNRTVGADSLLHTTEIQDGYDWGRLNLQSVTEESSLQEFLRQAELAETEFQAEKLNIAFIKNSNNAKYLSAIEKVELEKKHDENKNLLKIPRRPKWTSDTKPDELQSEENQSFLNWRRELAKCQDNSDLIITPYEKNIEFWRQLWRVVERSDVVVQIVDARNPLLFRSEDLEKYVKEVDEKKLNMILINKADFLTEEQRKIWADYFNEENIKVVFFSAVMAAEELNAERNDELTEIINIAAKALSISLDAIERQLEEIEKGIGLTQPNNPKILNRRELINLLKSIRPRNTKEITTIGLIGYPNVGKSSTINSLMGEKKTSVSTTPGKTKHFQTLYLEKDVVLCDCPGLVLPSFVLTKAHMVLSGILPIDQMRDHIGPATVLCTQIPRHILEKKYGIVIAKPVEGEDPNRPPSAEELLLAYGYNRGFMTANGQPDQSRSARYVLKDYVNGKLLYCQAPPIMKQELFHKFPEKDTNTDETSLPDRQQRALRITSVNMPKIIDQERNYTTYIKSNSNFPNIRTTSAVANDSIPVSNGNSEKPWRNVKREKRVKLRKKYVHLDQH